MGDDKETPGTLDNKFGYHKPTSDAVANAHEAVRDECRWLAGRLGELAPPSHELNNAIEHIELAMFWANAGIARISNY